MTEPGIPSLDHKPPIMSTDDDPTPESAFNRLPDEIIEQVLLCTDPNSFASLVLLNSNWRRVSQRAHLYAHHLALCPATHDSKLSPDAVSDGDLPRLRGLFNQQIKRNLFASYVQPTITKITLISNAISSSSAPGGDGLQFSHSLRGHRLLAYNSSRIYVLDVQGPEIQVKRELKILRRPAAVCILDDGSLLAILSSDMQIDLYDLTQSPPRRKQSLILDQAPRAIALSPCGSVLAAAYQGGIEVSSITQGALPTDRRAVKCDAVDALAFSFDGTQLLGTTAPSQPPNTVIITAPYYDPGSQMMDSSVAAMWTTSILFPNTSRDCSHAVLLQESSVFEAEWAFTYDRSFETFRAVRIDDLRNGTTYFPGPKPDATAPGALLPSTLPAANLRGQLVSAGFDSKDVWVYGVPQDLEAVPETNQSFSNSTASGLSRGLSNRSASRTHEPAPDRVPQWQVLVDNLRNNVAYGRKVLELQGIGTVKWVANSPSASMKERLVVCAKGAQPAKPISEEDDIDFVDGGRVTIIDFDYSPEAGTTHELTIDVGTQQAEALEEEQRDLATEVAIVRRRTVAQQRRGGGSAAARAAIAARQTSGNSLRPPVANEEQEGEEDPLIPRRMATARDAHQVTEREDPEDATLEEVQDAFDAPYAHTETRSVSTLRRAATAAAMSRHRVPQAAAAGQVEYRRADGRREHPHESDADNWVPPPPPYSKDDPVDMPSFLRHAAIPGVGLPQPGSQPTRATETIPPVPPLPRTASVASRHDLPRIETSQRRISLVDGPPPSASRSAVATTASTDPSTGTPSEGQRRLSIHSIRQRFMPREESAGSDIYDASPPGSPRPTATSISPETTGSRPSVSQGTDSIVIPEGRSVRHFASADATSMLRTGDEQSRATPESRFRRLSSNLTWPRAPQPQSAQDQPSSSIEPSGFPYSAPVRTMSHDEMRNVPAPPLPRPDQMFRLHNRQDSMPPRRASGMMPGPAAEPTEYRTVSQLGFYPPVPTLMTNISGQPSQDPDQPLIISTPQGIVGAFDQPTPQNLRQHDSDGPVIHAPVARLPRPVPGSITQESTADRLDAIYNPRDNTGQPAQLTTSSLRYHTSMTRRESRARRSAQRNVQDAKSRGWTGRSKKKKRKGGKNEDKASNGGWTDITAPAMSGQGKQKKCIVM